MKRKLAIGILLIALLAVFLYLQNNWIGVTRLEVVSGKLPGNFDGFRILHLSDLHSKEFGRGQNRLVKLIAEAKPDIIVITGDLIDGRHYNENTALTLVAKAAEIAPVYYVTGNHEWWSGKFAGLESRLKDAGADILRDENRKITVGSQSVYLTGIDDPESSGMDYNEFGNIEGKLHATIPLLPADGFKMLLSHRPEAFYLYSGYGVDLAFCGHAHGGQFRIPFIGGFYSPDQGFFPKFTSGVYHDGESAMVVSRGLGNSQIPQRLFNRPEVVLVTLRASSEPAAAASGKETEKEKDGKSAAPESNTGGAVSSKAEPYLINEEGRTVQERILAPEGFKRVPLDRGSFGEYLRNLPLKAHGSKVMYYNGDVKPADVHEAVLDLDVGSRDLQQCADSIIRLRAEYLYGRGRFDEISFHFTNGFQADYSTWRKGNRISVSGNRAAWVRQGTPSNDYDSFRKYLDMVFAYAGTLSLSQEMKAVSVDDLRPGDVFIHGGTPGHAEIVLDVAVNQETGKKRFLLAQGYMPAQEMHILKNPENGDGNPWYAADFGETLDTPEWDFSGEQLMRFKE